MIKDIKAKKVKKKWNSYNKEKSLKFAMPQKNCKAKFKRPNPRIIN